MNDHIHIFIMPRDSVTSGYKVVNCYAADVSIIYSHNSMRVM